jgi:hypothetical protein
VTHAVAVKRAAQYIMAGQLLHIYSGVAGSWWKGVWRLVSLPRRKYARADKIYISNENKFYFPLPTNFKLLRQIK